MKIKTEQPDLYIYTPDRRETKGIVVQPQEFSVDYNFNAASQMSFKVNKFIYDEHNECWVKNPCYEYLNENMLVATSDTAYKYKFDGSKENSYALGIQISRNSESTGLGYNTVLHNATLQKETELFDIGNSSGYKWQYYCHIDDYGSFINCSDNDSYHRRIACQEFIPVSVGDIIAIGSKVDDTTKSFSKSGTTRFTYRIHYYSEPRVDTHTKCLGFIEGNPVSRIIVPEGVFGANNGNNGYIRIEGIAINATLNDDGWYSYSPRENYIKVYSGERRCSSINGVQNTSNILQTDRWFVIENIKEHSDFINSSKTVALKSYEYVLSKKSFSISQSTLPLYIPEAIPNLVNSNKFIIDSVDGVNYKGAQRMQRGLINQILDYIPDWSVKYFSPEIITRYRTIDNIDNGNIYSFLINTVQSLYNCWIVFDTENKTISLISQDDIIKFDSNAVLTWDNVLKSIQITNSDTKYVTAMRVHTADDQYSIGLVNPTGNNVIYNFNNIKENLDFVADPTHYKDDEETQAYTLKEVVELYTQSIQDTIKGSQKWGYTDSYRESANKLIESTKKHVNLSTKLSELLSEYKSLADTINIYLQDDFMNSTIPENYLISDNPRSPSQMKGSGLYAPVSNYRNYHSKALYTKLYSVANTYYECKIELAKETTLKHGTQEHLKYIALIYSLNYKTLQTEYNRCQANDGALYYPIFTPKEALALSCYIYEADWTDTNAVFSEKYSSSDIMSTLIDVYDDAKQELDSIYSKQTYEFSLESANIFLIPEMSFATDNIYIGNSLYIVNNGEWIQPVLLSVHINYGDKTDFSMIFSTDYKRKPIELRFSDLFGTINQISTETPAFTFDK